jgi:hypothetical protein
METTTPVIWAEHEELIPLKSPRLLGLEQSYWTVRRWADPKVGLYSRRLRQRVVLESWYDGGVLCTSKEAVLRFLRRVNGIAP